MGKLPVIERKKSWENARMIGFIKSYWMLVNRRQWLKPCLVQTFWLHVQSINHKLQQRPLRFWLNQLAIPRWKSYVTFEQQKWQQEVAERVKEVKEREIQKVFEQAKLDAELKLREEELKREQARQEAKLKLREEELKRDEENRKLKAEELRVSAARDAEAFRLREF